MSDWAGSSFTAAMKAVAAFVAYIAALIGVLVIGGGVVLLFFANSASVAEEYYAGCKARSIEHRLDRPTDARLVNLCMMAAGYRLMNSETCTSDAWTGGWAPVSSCYVPRWFFWVEKRLIVL